MLGLVGTTVAMGLAGCTGDTERTRVTPSDGESNEMDVINGSNFYEIETVLEFDVDYDKVRVNGVYFTQKQEEL